MRKLREVLCDPSGRPLDNIILFYVIKIEGKTITDPRADTVVIVDFETTGLSPDGGDRAIEVGAVRIENGEIKERFQELMNPGWRINSFIEDYTGITNAMLKKAPPCEEVMGRFAEFIGNHNMVAHNASFDKRFLDAELERISRRYSGFHACSMLAARRIYCDAPNHQLGTLVRYKKILNEGVFHRALYDSEMTTKLWLTMLEEISEQYNIPSVPFKLMQQLTRTPIKNTRAWLERWNSKKPKQVAKSRKITVIE